MIRNCDSCGLSYDAKRPNSRFCGQTCRKRHQRSPEPKQVAEVVDLPPRPAPESGLVGVIVRKLTEVDRLDSVLGQQAVALAERIVSPYETGASVASLSKELRAVMESALADVGVKADPVDDLKAFRDRKRVAAAR